MAFEDINRDAARLCELIGRWQDGFRVSEIERQLVLDKLKTLYEQVCFMPVTRECETAGVFPEDIPAGAVASAEHGDDRLHEAVCPETEKGMETVSRKRPLDRSLIHTLYEETEASTDKPGDTDDTPTCLPEEKDTFAQPVAIDFDPDDLVATDTCYGGDAEEQRDGAQTPAAQEKREMPAEDATASGGSEAAAGQPARILGEVINAGCHTLGDAMQRSVRDDVGMRIGCERIDDLHKAIGINDKFMLIRDLFEGDSERYGAAIDRLNAFDDLDDAMLYIQDQYAWQPDSEAAQMLVELLCRKLL